MKNFLLNIILQATLENGESLFRSSGKIYVVVGILTIIFICIILYLVKLDKKISKLENPAE